MPLNEPGGPNDIVPLGVVDAAGRKVPCELTRIGEAEEVNVAAAAMGSKATASSAFGPAYGAEKAIDGRWAVRDPDPALGGSDKWNTATGAAGPHWLTIDFGRTRTIHKVVIRHEGVMGALGDETHTIRPISKSRAATVPPGRGATWSRR